MKSITKTFLEKTFPLDSVKFAFSISHIDRYKMHFSNKFKNPYEEDLVISVTDVKKFHQENFQMNKKHYPATSKFFKAKLVTYFQYYGAKVHFNYIPYINEDTQVTNYIRYMIIEHSDLVRDLNYWETFSVSNIMHRPINVVYNDEWFLRDQEIQEALLNNRKSGLSMAILTSRISSYPEKNLYSNILNLTKYQSKGLKLIDYEDTDLVVEKQFDKFSEIYRPILELQEPFKSEVQLIGDKFKHNKQLIINSNQSKESQIKYLIGVNDNVFKNFEQLSVKTYDTEKKYSKRVFTDQEKLERAQEIIEDHPNKKDLNKELTKCLDKIMIANRNTKLFFILMSGPFLVGLMLFKYAMKIFILYLLYKKGKGGEKEKVSENKSEKSLEPIPKPALI
eukprot:403335511